VLKQTRRNYLKAVGMATLCINGSGCASLPPASRPTRLSDMDCTDTVLAIRDRSLGPVEAVSGAIERIERLNPELNAVISRRYEAALAEAKALDRALPLAGLPILLKDSGLEGEPFYAGSRALAQIDNRFAYTDVFTNRLRAAGAVILGYTNTPEFMSRATTESVLYGPCRNPWNPDYSSGGSSGGAAVAVASGMVAAAQTSDGGGSTRIPASATGVFSIKTSRGRTPLSPSKSVWGDITSVRSFATRSVRDFALLLDIVEGAAPDETVSAPSPARPYTMEVGASTGRLRIGFTDLGAHPQPCSDEARAAMMEAARLLRELGHSVEEAAPATFRSEQTYEILMDYWPIKIAASAAHAEKVLGRALNETEMEPAIYAMLQNARKQKVSDFAAVLGKIHAYTHESLRWWETYDLLLTPMTGVPTPRLGELTRQDIDAQMLASSWGSFAPFANITGQPAACLPLHETREGMPLGIQLVAGLHREDLLIRVSAQLECVRPWCNRRPSISAFES
jgi:amidase